MLPLLGSSNTEPDPEETQRALITLLCTFELSFGSLLKVTAKNAENTVGLVRSELKKKIAGRKNLRMSCVMAVVTDTGEITKGPVVGVKVCLI